MGAIQRARYQLALVGGEINRIATQYYISNAVLNKGFISGYTDTQARRMALMGSQLYYLSAYPHPRLKVRAYHEENKYWARAPLSRVIVPYGTRGQKDMKGSFEMEVNRDWLGAPGNGSDRSVWTGVIAHELMHNLGHMHKNDDYGDYLQINAVQQLVRTAGQYKKNSRCPRFYCDCRDHW